MKKAIKTIPTETITRLTSYSWPGNIRELQNLIERAVILSRGSVLEVPLAELSVREMATSLTNFRVQPCLRKSNANTS